MIKQFILIHVSTLIIIMGVLIISCNSKSDKHNHSTCQDKSYTTQLEIFYTDGTRDTVDIEVYDFYNNILLDNGTLSYW